MDSLVTTLAGSASGVPMGNSGSLQAGYNLSLTDLSGFSDALQRAEASGGVGTLNPQAVKPASEGLQALLKPLDHVNAEAKQLQLDAQSALASGHELNPAEIDMLTVRAPEFLFHSKLTANVANRTSDGLQQVFRQQA